MRALLTPGRTGNLDDISPRPLNSIKSTTILGIMETLPTPSPRDTPPSEVAHAVPVEVIPVPASPKKDWNPSVWSFLCLLLGVVLLLVSPGFVIFSGPLFLACFILSIIAMAMHQILSGVLMMILVFTVAPLCTIVVFTNAAATGIKKVEEEKHATLASLSFEEVKGYRDGGYMYLKGRVRNNGTSAANFVKVEVDWLDKNGTILDTGTTFVVGLDKLQPGAAKSFEIMTPTNAKMSRYSYRFAQH